MVEISETIKLPVRYAAESNHIFAADGGSIAWFPRNTHHPDWHRKDETGEYIAKCINEHAALTAERDRLRDEVVKSRDMLDRVVYYAEDCGRVECGCNACNLFKVAEDYHATLKQQASNMCEGFSQAEQSQAKRNVWNAEEAELSDG